MASRAAGDAAGAPEAIGIDDGYARGPRTAAESIVVQRMEEFRALLELYSGQAMEVEASLDKADDLLNRLNRFLGHQPSVKRRLNIGDSLGPVVYFLRLLEAYEPEQKKRSTSRPSVPNRKSRCGFSPLPRSPS